MPVLHWVHYGSFALMARAPGSPSLLAAIKRLTQPAAEASSSLKTDPHYQKLANKVPPGELVFLARGSIGVELLVGSLVPQRIADIVIFDGRASSDHRAVIEADAPDVVLLLRAGQALYGDAALMESAAFGGALCEFVDVCGRPKRACPWA